MAGARVGFTRDEFLAMAWKPAPLALDAARESVLEALRRGDSDAAPAPKAGQELKAAAWVRVSDATTETAFSMLRRARSE